MCWVLMKKRKTEHETLLKRRVCGGLLYVNYRLASNQYFFIRYLETLEEEVNVYRNQMQNVRNGRESGFNASWFGTGDERKQNHFFLCINSVFFSSWERAEHLFEKYWIGKNTRSIRNTKHEEEWFWEGRKDMEWERQESKRRRTSWQSIRFISFFPRSSTMHFLYWRCRERSLSVRSHCSFRHNDVLALARCPRRLPSCDELPFSRSSVVRMHFGSKCLWMAEFLLKRTKSCRNLCVWTKKSWIYHYYSWKHTGQSSKADCSIPKFQVPYLASGTCIGFRGACSE